MFPTDGNVIHASVAARKELMRHNNARSAPTTAKILESYHSLFDDNPHTNYLTSLVKIEPSLKFAISLIPGIDAETGERLW